MLYAVSVVLRAKLQMRWLNLTLSTGTGCFKIKTHVQGKKGSFFEKFQTPNFQKKLQSYK